MVSRRDVLGSAGVIATLGAGGLSGCLGGSQNSRSGNAESSDKNNSSSQELADQLRVFSWYQQWHNEMLTEFKKKHPKVNTNLTSYGSNSKLYAKLRSGGIGKVDFITPGNNMLVRLRDQDMIQPIDTSAISRWDNLEKPIANQKPWSDFLKSDGKFWGVPFTKASRMNVTTKSKVEDNPFMEKHVDSWSIYFEESNVRTSIPDSPRPNVSAAIWNLRGKDADINKDPGSKLSWSKIENELVKMIENSAKIHSSSEAARRSLKQDQIEVVMTWGGEVIQLRNENNLEDAKAYFPKEGAIGGFDSICIPKNAPHLGRSLQYIDFILKPDRLIKEYKIEGNVAVQHGISEKMSEKLRSKYDFILSADSSKLQILQSDDQLQERSSSAWNNAKAKAS